MKMLNKKGYAVFDEVGSVAKGIAAFAIVMVVAFLIIAEGKTQIVSIDGVNESNTSSFTAGYNATVTLQDAMSDVPSWIPIIVVATIGGILLGLVAYFKKR